MDKPRSALTIVEGVQIRHIGPQNVATKSGPKISSQLAVAKSHIPKLCALMFLLLKIRSTNDLLSFSKFILVYVDKLITLKSLVVTFIVLFVLLLTFNWNK